MTALPNHPEAIPYRWGQLNPRWKARTEFWTNEDWHKWRCERIARLIREHKVLSQRELETRASDFVRRGTPRIEPHNITSIKKDLDLVRISTDPVPLYTRRKMRKLDYAEPLQLKRRLQRQYLDIATSVDLCGAVAEKVVFASMQEAATQQASLAITPHTLGEVTDIDGAATSGSLDTYCYYTLPSADIPREAIPVGVEVKNIREWLYPQSQELWQAIRAATELNVLPVIVTRRIHFTVANFCSSVGMTVFETQRQYFAPQLKDDPRLIDTYQDLYFRDVLPWDTADLFITKFFATTLPRRLDKAVGAFAHARDLLRSYSSEGQLCTDDLPPGQRTSLFDGFRAEFLELTGKDKVGW